MQWNINNLCSILVIGGQIYCWIYMVRFPCASEWLTLSPLPRWLSNFLMQWNCTNQRQVKSHKSMPLTYSISAVNCLKPIQQNIAYWVRSGSWVVHALQFRWCLCRWQQRQQVQFGGHRRPSKADRVAMHAPSHENRLRSSSSQWTCRWQEDTAVHYIRVSVV